MAASSLCFVEWKEQFVSKERGNRVVHYYLKDIAGESILAVVGTERSVRHMFYVVSEEFLNAHGAEDFAHAGYRWRSRREVVNWLTSMLSKQYRHGDHSSMSLLVLYALVSLHLHSSRIMSNYLISCNRDLFSFKGCSSIENCTTLNICFLLKVISKVYSFEVGYNIRYTYS